MAKKNSKVAEDTENTLASAVDGEGEDDAPAAPRAKKVDRSHAGGARQYKNSQTIDSDVFKLGVATMRKWAGIQETDDVFDHIEHVHLFRTFDSNGKRQAHCPPVGGHFHACTVTENADGVPTIEVSPPMVMVKKKVKGKTVLVAMLLSEHRPERADDHTHEVEYLRSEKLTLRKPNMEFAKVQGAVAAATPTLPQGITG